MGWFLQLVVAYTVVDIGSVISSDLGQPWASFLLQVLPQQTALAALSLTIVTAFMMGQGNMVAASRVTFAYARDGCFPFSSWISHVNTRTKTPVNAVWWNVCIGILMTFLIFGGSIAIGALFSIGAVAAFVAFTIPIFIRVFLVGNRFRPGPWNLGRFSMPIGAVASCFVILMVPILMLPSTTGFRPRCFRYELDLPCLRRPDAVCHDLVARRRPQMVQRSKGKALLTCYQGDHFCSLCLQVNIEHQMLGREGNVIEANDHESGDSSSGSMNKEQRELGDSRVAKLA